MSFKQKRIGMFHSWKVNSKINHLQKQSLRSVYNDHITLFKELLKNYNSFKIYHKNIQSLALELFKDKKGITNPILCKTIDIFINHNNCLRHT